MKIVLIGLASIYTEGLTYQDNLLADQLRADGNDVTIIVDCFKYVNGKIVSTDEEDKFLDNGIRLIRKKYRKIINNFISGKIRSIYGLYEILESLDPDIIFHHSLQTFEMLTIKKYKVKHPNVKFFVDSHEDFHNSATNFLSRAILHKIFYKIIIKLCLPYIDKVLCVSYESFDFLNIMYNIKKNDMELYPLGGNVLNINERESKRQYIRRLLELRDDDILIVHSGKMDSSKKTNDVIVGFSRVKDSKMRLLLIGSFDESSWKLNEDLINRDERIVFLGWKTGSELVDYLCACDIYMQPGTQSVTMQTAVCCGSAVAIYPYPSHKLLMSDSAFYIEDANSIEKLILNISENVRILEQKRKESNVIALELLDYRVLASRLYK